MDTPNTIRDIVDLWPSRKALADDLDGISLDRIHKWVQADAIPARYHQLMLEAAIRRSILLTAELLVKLHDFRSAASTRKAA